MIVTEPATMFTDYALALMCAVFAFRLHRGPGARSQGLWVAAFSVTALAALAGGTAHGFRAALGENWSLVWKITVLSIASGSALLVAAGTRAAMRPRAEDERARREGILWLKRAIGASFAGLVVLMLKLAPHRLFNHNDLYHVIQMGGLYCLYRGAVRLHGINESGRRPETGS